MTSKLFNKLYQDALMQPDVNLYVGEYGYPEWFDEINTDITLVVETLRNIHHVANSSMREIIHESGMTQAAFAERFCIPLRTVEDWAREKRTPPPYVKLMIAEKLGIVEK